MFKHGLDRRAASYTATVLFILTSEVGEQL